MTSHLPADASLQVRYDDGVPVLVAPESLSLAELRDFLRERVADVKASLGGSAVRLHLGDRDIVLFDLRRLLHMLREDHQVEITGLYVREGAVQKFAERELKLKLFLRGDALVADTAPHAAEGAPAAALPGLDDLMGALAEVEVDDAIEAPDEDEDEDDEHTEDDSAPASFAPEAQRRPIPLPELPRDQDPDVDDQGGRRVLTLRRTLRSGTSIRYDGDVYVFGDVNAGAQIRAGGSVIVFGKLRGQVHAGAQGDETAFVLAFDLGDTQIRIAKQIAIAGSHLAESFWPEIAHVVDGAIVVEPYAGRVGARRTAPTSRASRG